MIVWFWMSWFGLLGDAGYGFVFDLCVSGMCYAAFTFNYGLFDFVVGGDGVLGSTLRFV